MSDPKTIPEYVAASDEVINETLFTVRELVDELGTGQASLFLRLTYQRLAVADPSRCAGMLAHALVRLAERRP